MRDSTCRGKAPRATSRERRPWITRKCDALRSWHRKPGVGNGACPQTLLRKNSRMGSTYSALYSHLVFATKDRKGLILPEWEQRLYSFLGGCLNTIGGKALAIGGMSDHIHILMSLKAVHAPSVVVGDIKGRSSKWVHDDIGHLPFGWQDGYAIFSVSASVLDSVKEYINGQKEHHRVRTFEEEYIAFLKKHWIDYDERYVF